MDTNLKVYKESFLHAARENLAGMMSAVAGLKQNPLDRSHVEELFIKSHSLKGQSMTMGFTGIAKASLAIERYTRTIRDNERVMDAKALSSIDNSLSKIQSSLTKIEADDKEEPFSETITILEQVLSVKV